MIQLQLYNYIVARNYGVAVGVGVLLLTDWERDDIHDFGGFNTSLKPNLTNAR